MMGERSAQEKLFAADHIYLDYVGRETLYGYLAQYRGQLFRDEDFAILYCRDNGRPSVPPSLAVSILFLRAYEVVSFVEAIERTKYDPAVEGRIGPGDGRSADTEECAAGVSGPTRAARAGRSAAEEVHR
jgi:hypothetical protein